MSETAKKPVRGRPKTLNKADVINVAMRAYWQEGPSEVSLNAICQRAGVSKPSIYREFGNDDGLAAAALDHYAQTVLSKIVSITGSNVGFSSKISLISSILTADEAHEAGCLFVKMRAVKAQLGPNTQARIARIEALSIDAFQHMFAEGRASGDISIELAARYMFAQVGLVLEQRARGEDPKDTLALALSVLG